MCLICNINPCLSWCIMNQSNVVTIDLIERAIEVASKAGDRLTVLRLIKRRNELKKKYEIIH